LDTVHLLNHLNVDGAKVVNKPHWVTLLVGLIRSDMGLGGLTPHNWHLLEELVLTGNLTISPDEADQKVMSSLKKAGEWEKLGVWMLVVWLLLAGDTDAKSMEGVAEVTQELLSKQPLILPGYESLYKRGWLHNLYKVKLEQICQAQAEQLHLEPSPLL